MRKFAHDKRLNIGACRLDVFRVGSDVADVRIGEADDLPSVAGIGENFLVPGKAGIENNFAATADAGARGATLKDSTVLERERRATCERLRQLVLPRASLRIVRRR